MKPGVIPGVIPGPVIPGPVIPGPVIAGPGTHGPPLRDQGTWAGQIGYAQGQLACGGRIIGTPSGRPGGGADAANLSVVWPGAMWPGPKDQSALPNRCSRCSGVAPALAFCASDGPLTSAIQVLPQVV